MHQRQLHSIAAVIATALRSRVTFVLPALLGAALLSAAPQQSTGLVEVVGHWMPVDDGGPALQAMATMWSGQNNPATVRSVAQSLFGRATDAFVTNQTAAGAFPLAVHRDTADFRNGTIRVRFKLVSGASDQTAGIVFNLQPTGEYTYARYNTKDGDVALWRFAEGTRHLIAHGTTHAQLPLNTWQELTVTVNDRQVAASVPGSTPISITHTLDGPVSGRVGLWTKRDSVTTFRDFRVNVRRPGL
jgi:hypothetical protein